MTTNKFSHPRDSGLSGTLEPTMFTWLSFEWMIVPLSDGKVIVLRTEIGTESKKTKKE